jgi:hypothetical protein
MAKEINENTNLNRYGRIQYLDTGQLEYTSKQVLIYGTIVGGLLVLSVTYVYLLAQKIKN